MNNNFNGNINIIGKYIGKSNGIIIGGVMYKKNITTNCIVNRDTFKRILSGIEEGWFELYEPTIDNIESVVKKELNKITYDDTEVRNQISSLQSEMGNTGKEITQIKAGIKQVSSQIDDKANKFELIDNSKNFHSQIGLFLNNNKINDIKISKNVYNSKTIKTTNHLNLSDIELNLNNSTLLSNENGYDSVFSNFSSLSPDLNLFSSTITETPVLGSNSIVVSDASGFSVGDSVMIRYGDNIYDNVECKYILLTEIENIDGNTITLKDFIPFTEDINGITKTHNKSIAISTSLSTNFNFKNARITTSDDVKVISGLSFRTLKDFNIDNMKIENINGIGFSLQYCNNGNLKNFYINNIKSHSASAGRAISLSECNNISLSNLNLNNLNRDAIFIESYSKNIVLKNSNINKTTGVEHTVAISLIQESELLCDKCTFLLAPNYPLYNGGNGQKCNLILKDCTIKSQTTLPSIANIELIEGVLTLCEGDANYKYDFNNIKTLYKEIQIDSTKKIEFDGLCINFKIEYVNITSGVTHYCYNGRTGSVGEQFLMNEKGVINATGGTIGSVNALKSYNETRVITLPKLSNEPNIVTAKITLRYAPKVS